MSVSRFLNGQPTEVLGTQRTGSFLRSNARTPATDGRGQEYPRRPAHRTRMMAL